MEFARQKFAKKPAEKLAFFVKLPFSKEKKKPEIRNKFISLFPTKGDKKNTPAPVRWEYAAAAAISFGDIILMNQNGKPDEFMRWLAIGEQDTNFTGLAGLLSYGDISVDLSGTVARMAAWAEEILSGSVKADEWLENGVDLLMRSKLLQAAELINSALKLR